MAGANWDTFAVDLNGKKIDGEFESRGIHFEIYKNWIYVGDPKGWREDGGLVEPTVMEISRGDLCFHGTHVLAWRGPQKGVYVAIWTYGKDGIDRGMIGCGVYGFSDDNRWVGVTKEALTHLRNSIDVPEELLAALDAAARNVPVAREATP